MSRVLPVIVVAQFLCTTLWFVGNAVMPEIVLAFELDAQFFARQTSSVQFGFISGTLVYALLTVADRFSPSKVFFASAFVAAAFNLAVLSDSNNPASLLVLRFMTGFFLAGIYPVGMKIAADYFEKGLGKSLGFLVGALVLGTAFPHLLRGYLADLPWKYVVGASSCFGVAGGALILLFVPDGPHRRAAGKVNVSMTGKMFTGKGFRSAAFGYFGHMWELYAFWTFVPAILTTYTKLHRVPMLNISVWSFVIIGVGCFACIAAGYLSNQIGARATASIALAASGFCCLVSPLLFSAESPVLFLAFLVTWGAMVVADSPMFSSLVAANVSPEQRGTALTLVNCIGFSITIVSIQVLSWLSLTMPVQYLFLALAPGPVLGLVALAQGQARSANH